MNLLRPLGVSADDRGLLLGDGIFETVRLYAGRPFRMEAHLERMVRSARVLGLPVPPDLGLQVAEAVKEWGEREGALRITLTRGSGRGLSPPSDAQGRLLLSIAPIPRVSGTPERGLNAAIRGRIDEHALTSQFKAIGYMERIHALRLAREAGADEALLTNSAGSLVEGSASNLFAVRENTLLAPGAGEGALVGITRAVLLEGAREAGIQVEERGIRPDELARVSEIFLSSSVREIVAVITVEGAPVGTGEPGPIFQELSARYRTAVERETS